MSSPDISPMLARLTGGDYKRALKARLEELADETDDAAYASRLRLVARGERPLRTLASDSVWTKQFEKPVEMYGARADLSDGQRESLDELVAEARARVDAISLSPAEVKDDALDITQRAERTREVIRQEELSGWGYVHQVNLASDSSDDRRNE